VIAAGVGDDSALAVCVGEGSDFVVGSTKFEGADGLLVFGFEVEAAGAVISGKANSMRCVRFATL